MQLMAKTQPEIFRKHEGPQRNQEHCVHVNKKIVFHGVNASHIFPKTNTRHNLKDH